MVYSIKNTRNTEVETVADSILKVTDFGLRIPGKNYTAGYGEAVAQNWLHIIENFACPNNGSDLPVPTNTSVSLTTPVLGQQWYDTTNSKMRAWDGAAWTVISGAAVAAVTPPGSPISGDVWFNTTTDQLFVHNGTDWLLVGPPSDSTELIFNRSLKINLGGTGGAASGDGAAPSGGTTTSGLGTFLGNILTGIWTDTQVAAPTYYYSELNDGSGNVRYYSFSPYDTALEPGLNIENAATDYFNGRVKVADAADSVAGIISTELMRNDNNVGADTSRLPSVGTLSIGSSGSRWQTMYATTFDGTATAAQYADVAERYETDTVVEAGTVMKLGGAQEVTPVTDFADISVFGIVSDKPALRMNEGAGSDTTHPFIAFSGRLSVQLSGTVEKGQRLVASGITGYAEAVDDEFAKNNILSIIGRSLETKTSIGLGSVEVIVGAK